MGKRTNGFLEFPTIKLNNRKLYATPVKYDDPSGCTLSVFAQQPTVVCRLRRVRFSHQRKFRAMCGASSTSRRKALNRPLVSLIVAYLFKPLGRYVDLRSTRYARLRGARYVCIMRTRLIPPTNLRKCLRWRGIGGCKAFYIYRRLRGAPRGFPARRRGRRRRLRSRLHS